MPEKIFIVCSSYYPDVKGGGEISTKLLAESLLLQGVDVEVVTFTNKNDHVSIVDGVIVNRLHHCNIYWSFDKASKKIISKFIWHVLDRNNDMSARKIIELAKRKKVSHIITSTIEDVSTSTWKLAKKHGIKVSHILRSYTLLCPNATMFKNGENCEKQCFSCSLISHSKKKNSQFVDNVIGISRFILNKHMQAGYFNRANRYVIPNICSSHAAEIAGSATTVQLKNRSLRLGYLGNVLPTKGIDSLIKAISASVSGGTTKLYIAGDGNPLLADEYRKMAVELSADVTFMGHVPPRELFDKIDFLVVPSNWHEPFGRIIIEAYEYHIPVIGRSVGGIPELILDKRFLFNSDNDLVEIINMILSMGSITYDFPNVDYSANAIVSSWRKIIS